MSTTENQSDQIQEPGGDKNKIDKSYAETLLKLEAVFNKPVAEAARPYKVPGSGLAGIVDNMMKADIEKVNNEVAEQLKGLLAKFLENNKAVSTKKKELDQLEQKQKKDFVESCKTLFNRIDGLPQLQQDYIAALKLGVQGSTSDNKEAATEKEEEIKE